jgi:hypothetical protein
MRAHNLSVAFGTRLRNRTRTTGEFPISTLLILASGSVVIGVIALHSAGWITFGQAAAALFMPLLLIATGFRPAWLVLLLIGIPPFLLSPLGPTPLILLALGTLIAQLVVRGTVYLDWRSGLLPLGLLVAAALVFPADVSSEAASIATGFLRFFIYYLVISAVSYNAARLGDLRANQLANALLLGLVGTALVKLAVTGLAPPAHPSVSTPAAELYSGRLFAYLAVLGFSVSFTRWLLRRSEGNPSTFDLALAVFFSVMIASSLVRGAWISALLVVVIIAGYMGRRSYWLLLPLAVAVVLAVPVARERITPSTSPQGDITTGRWLLWTTLWEDHVSPALPGGNGFGYASSLTSNKLFGYTAFVVEGGRADLSVSPHNDFLFWMLEFGIWGLVLWLLFWIHLMTSTRWLIRKGTDRTIPLLFIGILVTMFISQLVNGTFFSPALSERFFVVSGFLFGARAAAARSGADVTSP